MGLNQKKKSLKITPLFSNAVHQDLSLLFSLIKHTLFSKLCHTAKHTRRKNMADASLCMECPLGGAQLNTMMQCPPGSTQINTKPLKITMVPSCGKQQS